MTDLQCLQKIAEVDNVANFFIEHIDELQNENDENFYVKALFYSNALGIEFEEQNPLKYRVYDPFGQITSDYRNRNGWTNWSIDKEEN